MPEPTPRVSAARAALVEITPDATIGRLLGEAVEEDGSITVTFDSALAGYPGWAWTVSLAEIDGEAPTVLEAELLPGDGALLAPDWVPWSERLAEYKAAQEAQNASDAADDGDADDEDLDGDSEDEDEDELDEDDVLGNDVLHGGDLDGVDIDDLDEQEPDDDDDEREPVFDEVGEGSD
ncbi:hypothetical protein M2152_000334 [Microbacteriaceae bacterium SG_E_30_P1]|uniref:DUF3027 domain-containing protein n=1 Tax=Antiquaquibacter oligotrophicus TaxID=2880260 RepID=A0ABT6KLZ2_9MICO|nr:DUF3027 domain-containing protein [Antiquaquibacter oligotrophicus]MDH6180152.1 hypothetical protein [Antiquaquibacter oligotrophicus]UDF14096.1 DUF3027 domain-containing protein [Antiquaquibacter oligotrophicus]